LSFNYKDREIEITGLTRAQAISIAMERRVRRDKAPLALVPVVRNERLMGGHVRMTPITKWAQLVDGFSYYVFDARIGQHIRTSNKDEAERVILDLMPYAIERNEKHAFVYEVDGQGNRLHAVNWREGDV